MNKILKITLLASALAIVGSTGSRAQTGASSATVSNSYLGTAGTDSTFEYAESLYIGPNAVWDINGVHIIYSKNVWIAPTAQISGTGKIIFANPDDNPFYPDMTGATTIDGNNGNFIDVNMVNANPNNIVLADIADPGYGITNPAGALAAALKVGKDFKFDVANGDVLIGDYDMVTATTATLSGYQPDRFVVTNGTGHLVHNNYTGTFTYPIGIAEGDYTPANMNNSTASDMHVMVQDYNASASVEKGNNGMQRTWNIYSSSATAMAVVDLQHNASTNQSAFNNASHFVTRYSNLNPNITGDNATGSAGPWQSNALVSGTTGTLSSTGSVSGSVETSRSYSNFATTATDELAYYSKSSNQVTPLPVTLMSFEAQAQGCNAVLTWETGVEADFQHFAVQRSSNGKDYGVLATVAAKGNNSSYTYTDNDVTTGTYQYRVSMVNTDGSYTYSANHVVKIACGSREVSIYPNPAQTYINVSGLAGTETIQLYNNAGQLMISRKTTKTIEQIDLRSYAAGMYQVIIIEGNNLVASVKVIRQY